MPRKLIIGLVSATFAVSPVTAGSNGPFQPTGRRPPTAADGAPAFQPGMLWLDNHAQTWAMGAAGKVGQATWVFREPAAAVIDEVGGEAPAAAYGTRRLTSWYDGPAFKLRRTSDGATRDIAFLSTSQLDEERLASFCARTECRVAIWYDQSGNRRDATQTSPAAQPVVRLSHRTGNSVSIVWDYEATSREPPRWLELPPALVVDDSSMAILWTGRFHNASLISPLLELGTDDNPFDFGFWDAHGSFYIGTPKQLAEMPGHAPVSASVGLISSSLLEGIVANYRNSLSHFGALKPLTHKGGLLGKTVAFHQNGMMELSSLIIYGGPLDAGARQHAVQALGENFEIPQQQQDIYVADGDSITQGLGSHYAQSYLWHMERLLPESLVLYDAAWAAKTLGGADGLVDRYLNFTAKLFNPNARFNIISLMAGTNDIQNHVSGQQVYQLVQQYAAAARHTGFKVIVSTILPRATFDTRMEYERIQANILVRTNWRTFADGLADFAADPTLGTANATGNASIYCDDGVHLTDYGYQIMAGNLSAVVSGLTQE